MKNALTLFLLFTSLSAFAGGPLDPKDVPWVEDLKQAKVFFFFVCGNANIRPTQKSLNRDFAFGSDSQGYFFTAMPGIGEYWSSFETQEPDDAKAALRARFEKSHLWRHSSKGLVDLGAPTKIEFPSTICISKDPLAPGLECRKLKDGTSCCVEKKAGSMIYWGANQEYILKYSPDPSVKLKVPGESNNRYCNFQEINEVKGSGR